jgi:hypothetical protein
VTILFKLICTSTLVAYVLYVLSVPDLKDALLAEVYLLGVPLALAALTLLFVGVGFYARALERCLAMMPNHRTTTPRSVWLMFLLPFNFVEDFFIVHHLTQSIRAEARVNPVLAELKDFGAWTGFGWCSFQVLCFLPNEIGKLSAVLALVLWWSHWAFIHRVNQKLSRVQREFYRS